MIFSLLLAVVFFFILFFFGWQLARYFLKENRIEYLMGLSGVFGMSFYVFFVNALGHFVPIKTVFYFVLFLFFILGLVLFYFDKSKPPEWEIDEKWRKILLGTVLLLIVSSGIIAFRLPLVLHGPGTPTAAVIAEGSFPPPEIWNPRNVLHYHYAPELFSAAINVITGLPVYIGHDFQAAILISILFLLGFCMIKRFFDNDNFKAFISSLLMIYAGSLVFLNGIKGIPILYNLYIRHQEIAAPFKFVSETINSQFSVPVLRTMLDMVWGPWVFPLIIAVLYLYFHLTSGGRSKIVLLLCALLSAVLGHFGEIYFAVLFLILLIYPFIFGLVKKDWQKAKNFLTTSFWILLIATPLAFVQGGFLRSVLNITGSRIAGLIGIGDGLFNINEVTYLTEYFEDAGSPIFRSEFFLEWSLLLVVLIPAFIFLLKRNFQFGSFLVIFAVVSFLLPIFFTTNNFAFIAEKFGVFARLGEMWRFFFVVNLIGGLAAGLFLADLYLSSKKIWLKRAALFIIAVLMLQGSLFQLLYLSVGYPAFTWNAASQYYTQPSSFEKGAYGWIRENTTVNDYFLITERDCSYTLSFTPNYRFVLNTGRMAPIYSWHCSYPDNDSFKKIKETCAPSAIADLKYSYLYVNEGWVEGLEEKCLANNNLELKFNDGEENKFARIYKVLK